MSTDAPPLVNGSTMYGKAYMPHSDDDASTNPHSTSYTPLDPAKFLAGEGGIQREPVPCPHPTFPLTPLTLTMLTSTSHIPPAS